MGKVWPRTVRSYSQRGLRSDCPCFGCLSPFVATVPTLGANPLVACRAAPWRAGSRTKTSANCPKWGNRDLQLSNGKGKPGFVEHSRALWGWRNPSHSMHQQTLRRAVLMAQRHCTAWQETAGYQNGGDVAPGQGTGQNTPTPNLPTGKNSGRRCPKTCPKASTL